MLSVRSSVVLYGKAIVDVRDRSTRWAQAPSVAPSLAAAADVARRYVECDMICIVLFNNSNVVRIVVMQGAHCVGIVE
jgi:hypothetical protein